MNLDRSGLQVKECDQDQRVLVSTRIFAKGDLIERAPIMEIPAPNYMVLKNEPMLKPLRARTFTWCMNEPKPSSNTGAIVFGLMVFCNHNERPNAEAIRNVQGRCIELVALTGICAGDEITIRYHTPEIVSIGGWEMSPS